MRPNTLRYSDLRELDTGSRQPPAEAAMLCGDYGVNVKTSTGLKYYM